MAAKGLVQVHMSIATLDHALSRLMDPRATSPTKKVEAIGKLAAAGVPVSVYSSPMIPAINDKELESILEAAAGAGARFASFTMVRLPLEVRDLFVEWLQQHFPLRAQHVMSLIQQMRGGQDYDTRFGARMSGTGEFADVMAQRFRIACSRLGLNKVVGLTDVSQFRAPREDVRQQDLF